MAQLRFEQVSLQATVGQAEILQDLSFSVEAGELVGLVGPSGAGKTSLLRLINRLSDPSQGRIFWEGQDLRQLPVIALRQQIMLVAQEPKLLDMTVEETLWYPLRLRHLARSQAESRIQTWLERLQIPSDWLSRSELELSVGQRQRVAIARALVTEPKILLLDEPTSALDAGNGMRLMNLLQRLAQQQTTILIANHQLDLLQPVCSRILHLEQGKIVQDLPHAAIDWPQLRQAIVQAQQQEEDEWQ
ncbi:MAG: ATP-binding cassette domain-containing protein [Leptolyngbya sp. SIO4C5]|uniref:cell division ATP-binding protein FtsE n=1 Tax=Sphaerothrix gracilis TaxID=3151835 RepID=UPI0013C1AEF2|nr:ATP-binding cassette domain-containing protein [Leptolyngbya sp. SIO4C5]